MLTKEYVRPYIFLATHIKSHAIDVLEFSALLSTNTYECQVVTQYYTDNKRYTVTDGGHGRTYDYTVLLKQTETAISPALESVMEYYQNIPVIEFVNHGNHAHVRQKITLVLNGKNLELEILLHGVRTYTEVLKLSDDVIAGLRDKEIVPEVLSLSYRQWT